MLFGNEALKSVADAAWQGVRSTANFNWTFIALLAFVVYVYASEWKSKQYKAIAAGLSLYVVHWFYEILNGIIRAASGYALWTVTPASTTFMLLIGVGWELSMMFAVAGIATSKLLPEDPKLKILGVNNRWLFAVLNAALFGSVEIFLAGTPAFVWVYPWWGALPVFVTVYVPFFLAAFLVPDAKPRTQKLFIGGFAVLDILLLAVLIPLGVL